MPIYYGNQKIKPHGIKEAYYGSKKIYSAARLPSAYQEVEYIGSTGTQYIDTGCLIQTNSAIELLNFTITDPRTTNWLSYLGSMTTDGASDMFTFRTYPWVNNHVNFTVGTKQISQLYSGESYAYLTPYKFRINDIEIQVEQPSGFTGSTYHLYMFGTNSGGNPFRLGYINIGGLNIYQDGVKIRQFIPCYRKSDNEIGLYDIVNNQFYTNQGSGTFIKGNDI